MARGKRETWTIGFIGTGLVEQENVKDLLDSFMPDGADYDIYIPESIPRAHKGMKNVWNQLDIWEYDYVKDSPSSIVDGLDDSDNTYLIVLWDNDNPDDETAELIQRAIEGGIKVKNLCDALDDMEIIEEEETPEPETPKRRGKPRTDGPTMETTGPATIVGSISGVGHGVSAITSADVLLNAIRQVIREEVQNMGLSIGHNTFIRDLPEQDEKIKVWYSDKDDSYVKADPDRKAPRGKKTVEITKSEAASLGIE